MEVRDAHGQCASVCTASRLPAARLPEISRLGVGLWSCCQHVALAVLRTQQAACTSCPLALPHAVFFRVHSCGQLEYMGTSEHPSPEYVGFEEACAAERPVSPGYVTFEKKVIKWGSGQPYP